MTTVTVSQGAVFAILNEYDQWTTLCQTGPIEVHFNDDLFKAPEIMPLAKKIERSTPMERPPANRQQRRALARKLRKERK